MSSYLDPHGRRIGWLITEIEKQTEDRLSEESRQHLLDEVECHLDAAVRARLELGMSPIEAEKEAVEAFGHPKAYVDDLLKVHEGIDDKPNQALLFRMDPWSKVAFWCASVVGGLFLLASYRSSAIWVLLLGVGISISAFAVASFRARRIQAIPIFGSTLLVYPVIALAFSFCWVNLYAHGDMGLMPRSEAVRQLARDNRILVQLDPLILPLEHHAALHNKFPPPHRTPASTGDTAAELRFLNPQDGADGWESFDSMVELEQIPVAHDIPNFSDPSIMRTWAPGPGSQITFEKCENIDLADQLWKDTGTPLLDGLRSRRQFVIGEIDRLSGALDSSPLAEFPGMAIQAAAVIPLWFCVFGLINLIFGGLGWFLALPSSVRRKGIA
jgi:hypothetical protein